MIAVKKKTTRSLTFDGDTANWRMWSQKFLAVARKKGLSGILTSDVKKPEEDAALDETTLAGKAAIAIRKQSTE